MSNNIPQKPYKPLTPFQIFVRNNFPFVEGTYEARDYYDLLCKIYQHLKTVEYNQGISQENINALYEFLNNLDLQDEVNNKLDEMAEDGTLERLIGYKLFVTIEEFKEETDTDDTNAFNLAIADGRPIYLLDTNYYLSAPVTITAQTKIYGKSITESIINATHEDFVFNFLTEVQTSAYNIKTNIELNNFKVNCKNFIKINDNTLEQANWIKQASLLHLQFKNLWINGNYDTITDNNKDTNVIANLSTLLGYGCGFNLNSVFDSNIINCRLQNFGIACYMKGCDINNISDNRFDNNGNHIYLERISTYGSQNKINHNDMLNNRRYGGININGTRFETIENNYFESYTPAGCSIYANNEYSLSILNNRFDTPSQNTNVIEINPVRCDYIIGNRINPGSNTCIINVKNEHIDAIYLKNLNTAIIKNNDSGFIIKGIMIQTKDFNPLKFEESNLKYDIDNITVGGNIWASPYFVQDATYTNLYHIRQVTGNNLILTFKNLLKNYAKKLTIRIKYRGERITFYNVVKGDGTQIKASNTACENDNKVHTVDIDLTTYDIYDTVEITLPTYTDFKLYSVELV